MSRAVRLIVRGRVQGVGYRYFTLQAAEKLGVRGTVRNRSDGTVEVIAVADGGTLEQFVQALQQGPRFARVSAIDQEVIFLENPPESFIITH